jgi:hypothetical protein
VDNAILLAIPLVLFALLALALLLVLRRTATVVAETREMDRFRRTAGDLTTRIAASLGGAGERIDAVRRGQVAPDTIRETLEAASDAMERYRAEAEELVVPSGYDQLRVRLVEELSRAARALEMIDHGCATLTAATVGRAREAEGQTAIKRGYLNVLHAREAVVEIGTNLRSPRPSRTSPRWFSDRSAD